ncbi:MAG: hypothetical protein AMXMBFR7_04050 [Planctomycetota bacterium]
MSAPRSHATLAIVSMLHGATHLHWVLLQPLNPEIMTYFGLTQDKQIGLLHTVFLILYAASNLVAGILASRFAPRGMLAGGPLLQGACMAAMSLLGPGDFGWLIALHGLGAAAGGLYHPLANLLLTTTYPHEKGQALGIAGIGASVAFVAAPWSASALVHHAGWHWQQVAFASGCVGMLCGAIAWIGLPARSCDHEEGLVPLRPLDAAGASMRPLWLFVALVVVVMAGREMGSWGTTASTRQFLDKTFGAQAPDAGLLLALLFLPGLIIQPVVGKLSDRMHRELVLGVTMLVMAGALVLMSRVPPGWLWLPYMLLGAAMQANVPTLEALVADRAPLRLRGLVFGVMITSGIAIGSGGPILAGALADAGGRRPEAYAQVFGLLAALCAASAVMCAALRPAARALGLLSVPPPPEAVPAVRGGAGD